MAAAAAAAAAVAARTRRNGRVTAHDAAAVLQDDRWLAAGTLLLRHEVLHHTRRPERNGPVRPIPELPLPLLHAEVERVDLDVEVREDEVEEPMDEFGRPGHAGGVQQGADPVRVGPSPPREGSAPLENVAGAVPLVLSGAMKGDAEVRHFERHRSLGPDDARR